MSTLYDVNDIMKILPHRYPFLLVDKITEVTDEYTVGIKNVTINEQFFQGHFPGKPIMPGVLIVEAIAQVGGIMAQNELKKKDNEQLVVYFMGIDNFKFRKPVVPGDVLEMKVTPIRRKKEIFTFKGEAFVEGTLVAHGELMAYATVVEAE